LVKLLPTNMLRQCTKSKVFSKTWRSFIECFFKPSAVFCIIIDVRDQWRIQEGQFGATHPFPSVCGAPLEWRPSDDNALFGAYRSRNRGKNRPTLNQGRNEGRWRPGEEASSAPPWLKLRSFGSRCRRPRSHSAPPQLFGFPIVIRRPGIVTPLPPSLRPCFKLKNAFLHFVGLQGLRDGLWPSLLPIRINTAIVSL